MQATRHPPNFNVNPCGWGLYLQQASRRDSLGHVNVIAVWPPSVFTTATADMPVAIIAASSNGLALSVWSAMSYRLHFNETLGDGATRIAAEQVDRAIVDLCGNVTNPGEAVHQVRKRCKKIRGLWRLFRGSLPAFYSQENAWFRDLARSLSDARDAEAMLECLDGLCAAYNPNLEADAFTSVRHALDERLAALQDDAEPLQRMQDTAAKLQGARARVPGWRLDQDGFLAVERGLSRNYRRVRKALHDSYKTPTPWQFHEWRKRVKYHCYPLRLLRELWPAPMKELAAESKQLADILGDDHDLAVLRETLVEEHDVMGDQAEIDTLLTLVESRQDQLRLEAQILGWRLFAEKPKIFCRRLHAWWHATECEAVRAAGLAGKTGMKC